MYLEHASDPGFPADVFEHLRGPRHRIVTGSHHQRETWDGNPQVRISKDFLT